jgi:glycosyltransferase involved in cell wall biosynthesis
MKIAIFHCGFVYSGGGERIVLEQARGLIKRGYQIKVFAPTIDKKLCYPQLLGKLKVKTFLPGFIDGFPLRDAFRMLITSVLAPLFAFQFKDVDLFFGANQPGAWLAFCCAKVLKKPYLVYLNQPNRLIYPRKIDIKTGQPTRKDYYFLAQIIKLMKPLIAWLDKISIISAKALLVNGGYIEKSIKKAYAKKTVICPGGVYLQPKKKISNNTFQGSFKVKSNGCYHLITKPYLLIANRHEPQKRFESVIQALSWVLEEYPHASLVIPGSFTLWTPKLIALTKKLGISSKVIFTGQISEEDLQRLYQGAAVHCYPSPEEDFGLGPLEAAAWAVPTVAWNHAGPTVTIINNKTGFLAQPNDIKDYAQKILKLLKSPQQQNKMGLAAWKRVKDKFTWDKHLDILEREIKKI